MAIVFKVKSSTDEKLSLEAAAPGTPYTQTIFIPVHEGGKKGGKYRDISEDLQLELDLFPLQEGEDIVWEQNSHIRVVNTATPSHILERKQVVQ